MSEKVAKSRVASDFQFENGSLVDFKQEMSDKAAKLRVASATIF